MPVVFKSVIGLCYTEREWGQCWLYALEAKMRHACTYCFSKAELQNTLHLAWLTLLTLLASCLFS